MASASPGRTKRYGRPSLCDLSLGKFSFFSRRGGRPPSSQQCYSFLAPYQCPEKNLRFARFSDFKILLDVFVLRVLEKFVVLSNFMNLLIFQFPKIFERLRVQTFKT